MAESFDCVWAVFVALSLAGAACSTETQNGAPCYPGDYRYCACDDGVQGYSQCPSDGGDYGPCDCSGINPGALPDAAPIMCVADDAGKVPLLCSCGSDDQCESGLCFNFNAKGPHCTTSCTTANASQVCPPQSGGCSKMGVCMAP